MILSGCHGCGGAADPFFCVGKKIGGEAEDCVGEGWAWCEAVDCGGEVWIGARLACGGEICFARGVDCVGEVGAGSWKEGKNLIVLYRLADARHFPRRGKQAARIVGRDDGIVAL